ncbi:MAG: hypothetical protein R6X02_23600 [Enhygromyxa sp.]
MSRWMLSSLALTAACTGPVRYTATAQLPEEPLHYVVVATSGAPSPESVAARGWASSRRGKLELWSLDDGRATDESWVVADLGVAVIAEKLEVEQLLNAIERHRPSLHVVLRTQSHPPRMDESGLEAYCSARAIFTQLYDLDCELTGLRQLIEAAWVEDVEFYQPGWVRWR